MKLNGIETLYRSMKLQNITRYQFEFSFNKVKFNIMFFVDEEPFVLLFGVRAENISFEIKVRKGFLVDTMLENSVYLKLIKVLGLQCNPANPFRPIDFFSEFDKKVPTNAHVANVPKPHDVAYFRKDVEEADKIYFMGWLDNDKRDQRVSLENLDKTRKILGKEAFESCKRKNISSRWTDDKEKAISFYLP